VVHVLFEGKSCGCEFSGLFLAGSWMVFEVRICDWRTSSEKRRDIAGHPGYWSRCGGRKPIPAVARLKRAGVPIDQGISKEASSHDSANHEDRLNAGCKGYDGRAGTIGNVNDRWALNDGAGATCDGLRRNMFSDPITTSSGPGDGSLVTAARTPGAGGFPVSGKGVITAGGAGGERMHLGFVSGQAQLKGAGICAIWDACPNLPDLVAKDKGRRRSVGRRRKGSCRTTVAVAGGLEKLL